MTDRGRQRDGEVVRSIETPVYVLDGDGVVTYANDATATLLGRPVRAVVGERFRSFLRPDDATARDELVAELLDGPRSSGTLGVSVLRPDGEPVTVEDHVTVRSTDGEFGGATGVLVDVSGEDATQVELGRYETVVHALADPVYATDEEGYFTFVNPTFEELVGYSTEEVLGEPIHFEEVVSEEDLERILDLVGTLLSTDNDRTRGTVRIRLHTRDGRSIHVEDSLALYPYDEDEFHGVAGVLRDVGDRRRQEQRLQVMNRVLRHNLRNQMNVISGGAETIVELTDDPTVGEIARSIVEASAEMTRVSDNVRDLQKVVEDQEDVRIDAVEVVEDVVSSTREEYPDAAIVTDLPEELPAVAGKYVGYAFEHVLENAIEHNDSPDPRVEVGAGYDDEGEWCVLAVADNGPGIPEQDRAVVTGEAVADPLEHGSGLGLWIVNWIVESFDGRVTVDTPEENGTVVRILLPGR